MDSRTSRKAALVPRVAGALGALLLSLWCAPPAAAEPAAGGKAAPATAAPSPAKKAGKKGAAPKAEGERTTKKAEAVMALGLVASFTTKYPKGQPRVKNIHRIVQLLDGAVVEPGARFSLNHHVGKRTAKRGFVLAPSIGEGTIVETVGGGVSQVATTLYNAVFDAGYAVVSRKPHTRYFDRYPLGVEATLSWPRPDFVFRNDSKAPVLIRASVTDDSVTVKLYGDNGGRKVKRFLGKAFDATDPRVDWEVDESLPVDKPKVKDAGTKGFSVKAGRDIVFADGTKKHEERTVVYHGRPRVVAAHPCAIPKGEKGHRKKGCPKPPEPVDSDTLYASLADGDDDDSAGADGAAAKKGAAAADKADRHSDSSEKADKRSDSSEKADKRSGASDKTSDASDKHSGASDKTSDSSSKHADAPDKKADKPSDSSEKADKRSDASDKKADRAAEKAPPAKDAKPGKHAKRRKAGGKSAKGKSKKK